MSKESSQFEYMRLHECVLKRNTHEYMIRQLSSKYDIDISKYFLGSVLIHIIGDDTNCFGPPCGQFDSYLAQLAKEDLIICMNWEISLPETPDKIRNRLKELLPEVIQVNWQNEDEFNDIKIKWHVGIRDFVLEEISKNDEYDEAMMYKIEVMRLLSPEDKEFLCN